MKICIDVSSLILDKVSGLKSYTFTLINQLLELDKENEYILFYNYFLNRHNLKIPEWERPVKSVVTRIPRRILLNFFWKSFNFPKIEYFTNKIDIFHSLHTYVPPLRDGKTILSINDLREFHFPDEYKDEEVDVKLRLNSLKRTDFIITISENTKKEVVKFMNFPENKIFVVYIDLDEKFKVLNEKEGVKKVLQNYGINKDFILYVGNFEERKNPSGLLKSYFLFKEKYKASHLLVIIKGKPLKGSSLENFLLKSKYKEEVVFIPAVKKSDLICFYNAASCFVFPSLYEGFGLPPLEAMACGCPVVASSTSSIPEVVSDAGILVNPKDVKEMVEAIGRIVMDENLREELIMKGLKRAEKFKGKKMAKKTLEIYKFIKER